MTGQAIPHVPLLAQQPQLAAERVHRRGVVGAVTDEQSRRRRGRDPGQVDDSNAAFAQVAADDVVRHVTEQVGRQDQRSQQVLGSHERAYHGRRQSGATEGRVTRLARHGIPVRRPAVLRHRVQGDRIEALEDRVIGPGRERVALLVDPLEVDAREVDIRARIDERDVEFGVPDTVDDAGAIRLDQVHAQPGRRAQDPIDDRRDQVARERWRGADRDLGVTCPLQRFDGQPCTPPLVDEQLRVRQQHFAGVGEPGASPVPLQQRTPHARLEVVDAPGQRRLAHAEPLGGLSQAAGRRDRHESLELYQVHARLPGDG